MEKTIEITVAEYNLLKSKAEVYDLISLREQYQIQIAQINQSIEGMNQQIGKQQEEVQKFKREEDVKTKIPNPEEASYG